MDNTDIIQEFDDGGRQLSYRVKLSVFDVYSHIENVILYFIGDSELGKYQITQLHIPLYPNTIPKSFAI